jgi:mono/diheme cytochrome c family protein
VRQLRRPRAATHAVLIGGAAVWTVCIAAASLLAGQTPAAPDQSTDKRTVWSGVFSEAQAYRGEKVADTMCIGCHGAGLTGGDSGPKLVGERFMEDWNGKSVGDLFGWILEKMPDDAPGTLKKEDVASAIAYILKQNSMPTGKQDLPADADALAPIAILATKP